MMIDDLSKGRVTAKRKWESKEEYIEYLRHLAAYNFAKNYVKEKNVLEIGCGTGYGTYFLSKYASNIVGVDISEDVIQYCKMKYKKENLSFKHINGNELPFSNSSFDVCISFQVIEHINSNKVLDWLLEIRRILKDNGKFILSTPNKRLRLLPLQKPWNPEHKKEYTDKGLSKVLKKVFSSVEIYGLFGTEEIQAIEKERVKQKPLNVYVKHPLYSLLKTLSPSLVELAKNFTSSKKKGKTTSIKTNDSLLIDKYSLSDFKVSQGDLKECLDFYCVCIKGGDE